MISRKLVVFTLLVGCCFSVFLQPAPAQTDAPFPVRLLLDWYPQAEHGGYFEALVKGYYKDAGLDVKITPLGPSANGAIQVALGQFEFSLSTSNDVMISRKRGFPLVAVMATMQHDPQCIMVHADSPVKTFSDLSGHAISCPPGGAGLMYVIKKYNLTGIQELRNTVSTAQFIANPDFIQQAFMTAEPYFTALKGSPSRCLLYSDAGVDPYRVVFTSDKFLQEHPDIVKKFVAASIHGWNDFIADHSAAGAEILKENPAMTEGQMDYSIKVLTEQHFIFDDAKGEKTGRMTDQRWIAERKVLQDIGFLPADFDVTKAYTLSALPPN